MTNRLSAIVGCFGLVCAPLVTAAQSPDVDTLDAAAAAGVIGVSPDVVLDAAAAAGAVAPPDIGALNAALDVGALGGSPDAGAALGASPDIDVLDAPAPVAARRIIDRALRQAAEQRVVAFELGFEYFTDGRVESLDGDGRVTDTKTTRNRHYPLEGHFYSELIARDGHPLDGDAARDEHKRKADFIREARRHAERGEQYVPDEMRVDFDHELMDRYETTVVGTDVVDGRLCWVIRFEPREGRLPDERRLDKAMNRSSGRLWIAQRDYGVRRAEFEMQQPFRWLWGIAGTLRRASGRIDFRQVESNLWIPDTTLVEIELGVFFGLKTIRRRIQSEWVDPPTAPSYAALAP